MRWFGACIGHCPEGAITIESREAEPYSEVRVMDEMKNKGKNTIIAHLNHLKDHGETDFLQEGVTYLKEKRAELEFNLDEVIHEVHNHGMSPSLKATGVMTAQAIHQNHRGHEGGGCPGSRTMTIDRPADIKQSTENAQSELRQWPVQMHLINPNAQYFRNADLLVAADCVAYSVGGFHSKYLKGKSLAIACPKLDHGTEIYVEKLKTLIDVTLINTITVMIMEVPCCGGLLQMVKSAASTAKRKVPIKLMIAGITGDILREEWV